MTGPMRAGPRFGPNVLTSHRVTALGVLTLQLRSLGPWAFPWAIEEVEGLRQASFKMIWAEELRTADSPNAGQGTRTPRPSARLQKPGTPALLARRADSITATSAIW